MKKAYCCLVLLFFLSSSQNPHDFCSVVFPEEYEEHCICKVGEWHRYFLVPSSQSVWQRDWDGFARGHQRGEWSKSRALASSSACSLCEGCAKQLVVLPNLPSSSCSEGGSRLMGARDSSSYPSPQIHSSAPGARSLSSHSTAFSGIRISAVLLKWLDPSICFQSFCCVVGLKGSLVLDLRKKIRGSITIRMKCCLSAKTTYWDFFVELNAVKAHLLIL